MEHILSSVTWGLWFHIDNDKSMRIWLVTIHTVEKLKTQETLSLSLPTK